MSGPDQYEMDDKLMDELGGAMDSYDSSKMRPIVTVTVAVNDVSGDKKEEKPSDGDEAMPTPEEMDELQKAMG